MKRRQFINLTTSAAIASLSTNCDRSSVQLSQGNRIRSRGGLLEATLTAEAQSSLLYASATLAYNRQSPGSILEAHAGDTVRLTLRNKLDVPTNLHYHGLHISPQIDNVFREIPAGEAYTYEFQIPENHPAVTAWYHPHYHLMVAPQVFGGLAGPFIVRGDLDEIPEIQRAQEAVLVLQDFSAIASPPHPLGKRWGREGEILTVNGQQNPTIDLPQGGLLRLRLVNASPSRIYQLQLRAHPWFLIATDGGAIATPSELDTLLLAPGERAELLVPGQQSPGEYKIFSLPYDRGLAEVKAALGNAIKDMPGVVQQKQTVIATLRYQPGDQQLPVPQQLIPIDSLPASQVTREFVLDHGFDPSAKSTGFTINGESFNMSRVNTQVRLNQIEDWRIVNKASIDHPFHLHTNRFQILERNDQPETRRAWKDTVNVQGYETVTFRVRFNDYVGRTVYHCHILDHEDQGMMGVVEIL